MTHSGSTIIESVQGVPDGDYIASSPLVRTITDRVDIQDLSRTHCCAVGRRLSAWRPQVTQSSITRPEPRAGWPSGEGEIAQVGLSVLLGRGQVPCLMCRLRCPALRPSRAEPFISHHPRISVDSAAGRIEETYWDIASTALPTRSRLVAYRSSTVIRLVTTSTIFWPMLSSSARLDSMSVLRI